MSSTILNDIVRDYQSVSGAWFTALLPIAQAVFWTLVLIEVIWSAIWWVVDREDGICVVAALLRRLRAVDARRLDARCLQVVHLVLHQRQERRDHDRGAAAEDGRGLVTQ